MIVVGVLVILASGTLIYSLAGLWADRENVDWQAGKHK
jgi:hypothetical protein